MLKVGVTGGIGSGKTTICKMFELLGVPVYYADDRAKKLMTGNKILKKGIIDLLGKESYYRNGRLNRKYISQKIFKNKELLEGLNGLVHPAVGKDYEQWHHSQKNQTYTIKEAALLVENGSYVHLDKLIVVTTAEEIRIERVMKRDKVKSEQVRQRIKNQMKEAEKVKVADFVIDNSGEKGLIKQVLDVHTSLLKNGKSFPLV